MIGARARVVSFVSVVELRYGALRAGWGGRTLIVPADVWTPRIYQEAVRRFYMRLFDLPRVPVQHSQPRSRWWPPRSSRARRGRCRWCAMSVLLVGDGVRLAWCGIATALGAPLALAAGSGAAYDGLILASLALWLLAFVTSWPHRGYARL